MMELIGILLKASKGEILLQQLLKVEVIARDIIIVLRMSIVWILVTSKLCKWNDGNNNIQTIQYDSSGYTPGGQGRHPPLLQGKGTERCRAN